MNVETKRVAELTVTPDIAKTLLASNLRNRSLRPWRVSDLARAMTRGEWMVNGETIKLSPDGVLLDGQHRLAAVVESGLSIQMMVAYDIDPAAQETIDTGARRSLGDALRLRGLTDTTNLAAALVWLWRLRTGRLQRGNARGKDRPSHQQLLSLLESDPGLLDSLVVGRAVNKQIRYSVGLATALHYYLAEIDADDSAAFFSQLASGLNLDVDSPLYALRRYIALMDRGTEINILRLAAVTIKAWNDWRDGAPRALLVWKSGGACPEPFPTPR